MKNNFAIFILSNGRPDNVKTFETLKKCGNTYPVFIVVDDQDVTIKKYQENFGKDKVIVFDKLAISKLVDNGDNFNNLRTTTHVRNAIFEIAKERGIEYFLQLDDDYTYFAYLFDEKGEFKHFRVKDFTAICDIFIDYLNASKAKSICFLQGGDLFGGATNSSLKNNRYPFFRRKAMNSFFCKTANAFRFISRLNEDVNTYLTLGNRGELFMSIPLIKLNQMQTQASTGGMTDAYLDGGTFIKSFYTVMYGPSCTKVSLMGDTAKRLHHKINWGNAMPMILRESVKKSSRQE